MTEPLYEFTIPAAGHWSLRVRRGMQLKLTDTLGGANLGMLLYNPDHLLERYNAPDTLKAQHTFRITAGHCLYSDMGRIFCSVIEDSVGWHDTVCGNSTASQVTERFGERSYQRDRNEWHQNGHDAFLVELAKAGLGPRDLSANLNWFSKVSANEDGALSLQADHSVPGASVTLRFEMDTLVMMHTCPHPLTNLPTYPRKPVQCELALAAPVQDDDICLNHCEENRRGFKNNWLYHLGSVPASGSLA
ncbi:MAG: urea amidolyase associated protein UAAP1 [Burkholderiaceae bacterium]